MKRIYSFGMNDDSTTYWTAFYTKPRNEKKVAGRLLEKGYEIFCPCRTVVKQWSDRKKRVKEPLFTSYIFAKVNDLTRFEILMDSGIVANVNWLGQPAVIRDLEIEEIKSFLQEYPHAQATRSELKTGDQIMVDSGAFAGKNGQIKRVGRNKAYLSFASIGMELHAEIPLVHLKKVS